MTSQVEICNLALGNIRAGSINNLDEKSVQAQQCKLRYPILLNQLLRDGPFQFAHGVKPLALLDSTELFRWAYAYQYPADCLKVNRLMLNWESINNITSVSQAALGDMRQSIERQQVPYEILNVDGNQVIGSNNADLYIDYQVDVTDPNLFDSLFVQTFSWLLSAELAIPLIGAETGRQLRSDSMTVYQGMYNTALASTMNEQYDYTPDSEFVTVRS
jgi:hypothetical protein